MKYYNNLLIHTGKFILHFTIMPKCENTRVLFLFRKKNNNCEICNGRKFKIPHNKILYSYLMMDIENAFVV
jgi:hypothetical protein